MSQQPRLSEAARWVVQPKDIVSTAWPAVRDTCHNLGIPFDRWQDGIGRLTLAQRDDQLYAADTTLISICRQAGKTYLFGGIFFALCLIIPGLTVIWTAHRLRTAKETFRSMKAMARLPNVKPHIESISNANGEEGIMFRNGSRILFGARENGFGVGFANVGVLVLDEAQRLSAKAMDDLLPTLNTATNPLLILTGTPPRPTDSGEEFNRVRTEALSGESTDTLYIEFSADKDADLDDQEQWAKANPSFPHRTPERAIKRLRKNLSDDSFRREALGIHDDVAVDRPLLTWAQWTALIAAGPADGIAPLAFGLDMSHRREISISAVWITREGEFDVAHAEEVWAGGTPRSAEVWLAERAGRRIPVVVDAMSPAAAMVPNLKARYMIVRVTSAADMARACGNFEDRTVHAPAGVRLFTHSGQMSVTKAQANGRKRDIRDAGGWGWDRRDPAKPIHSIVSVTLGLLGAVEKYRQPSEVEEAVY